MSVLDRPKIEDAERVITDAENALSEVCQGKRRFEMCVPVQETDTDIVIGNALYIARALAAELAALRERERWIPVAERLPDVGAKVIVTDDIGENVAIGWIFEYGGAVSWVWRGHINRAVYWRPFTPPDEQTATASDPEHVR